MSISVEPSNPTAGQIITFKLKYEGNPPSPDDVHVEVENGGSWQAVTGYDHIPAGMNPVTGFDLQIPPTPAWSEPGFHRFRVRWTRDGMTIGSETTQVTTRSASPPTPPKEWDWGILLGKILGGSLGGAISSALFNWWTGAAIVVCIVTGAIGGAGGGLVGQVLVHYFDDPRIRWSMKSSFLFCLFFSLCFGMLFGLLSIDLEKQFAANGELFNRVTFGVTGISALLAAMLGGVLSNLRSESEW